mmetsp:Transcript_155218/g.275239  ORF Transcript_155218/g.275239 Transcript_155218/m.275239 type:complete len:138 (+) Transcript_155218:935-1348(+)
MWITVRYFCLGFLAHVIYLSLNLLSFVFKGFSPIKFEESCKKAIFDTLPLLVHEFASFVSERQKGTTCSLKMSHTPDQSLTRTPYPRPFTKLPEKLSYKMPRNNYPAMRHPHAHCPDHTSEEHHCLSCTLSNSIAHR